jgi:sugar phosphate isomerase/epimerase
MKAAFHSVGLPDRPVLDAIRMVGDAGYSAIELNAETLPWAGPHVTPETPAAERDAIVAAAHERQIAIVAVGAHIPMVEADEPARAAAIGFVKGCSDLARDVGAPVVHILSGPLDRSLDRRDAWRWFADAVADVTAHAENLGVTLAIEAIAGHMFHAIDDYHALRRDLPGVGFKVNFDPSHLIVQGENPKRVVDELGGDIVHVHMKDGAGRFPDFTFPPLGRGDIDFSALVEGLRRQGYAGALAVEYEAQVYGFQESERDILDQGRSFLRRLGT